MTFLLLAAARKRNIYDQVGEEGLKANGSGGGAGGYTFQEDPRELFAQFFGGKDPFSMFGEGFNGGAFHFSSFGRGGEEPMDFTPGGGGMFGGPGMSEFHHHKRQREQHDPPVEHSLNLSLEELFSGCSKKMKISRRILNPDGTTSRQDKVVTIDVKPGWKAGTKITFPREGDQGIGKIPADIVFVVREKPHTHFTRVGNDLRHKIHLPLRHALCGGTVEVPTIEGGTVNLPLVEVVDQNSTKRIPGHGMPTKCAGSRGDLIVEFDIKFPHNLNRKEKDQLAKILPVQ